MKKARDPSIPDLQSFKIWPNEEFIGSGIAILRILGFSGSLKDDKQAPSVRIRRSDTVFRREFSDHPRRYIFLRHTHHSLCLGLIPGGHPHLF